MGDPIAGHSPVGHQLHTVLTDLTPGGVALLKGTGQLGHAVVRLTLRQLLYSESQNINSETSCQEQLTLIVF